MKHSGPYLGFCQGGCTFLVDLPLPPHPDPHPHQNFELDPDPEHCFFIYNETRQKKSGSETWFLNEPNSSPVSRSKGFSFKSYLPDKPAKYGFLFKALGDAVYAYIYRTNIYAGKPVLEPTEYYIQGKLSLFLFRQLGSWSSTGSYF